MIIHDRAYGKITITQKVIVDLINSGPLQRLKKISQDGAPHFIQPKRNITRFEHSVGAWYLSKKYKRPIAEQIATLLHDIPHTAFSHVIDFVVDDRKHEYHDRFLKTVIIHSEIPSIFKKHDIQLADVLNKKSFPMLENNLPDISFDRLDYFLRDGVMFPLFPQTTVEKFLSHLKEKDAVFYFDELPVAMEFTILFLNASRLMWLDPTSHGAFFLMSKAIQKALEKKYISEKDFFVTDDELWKKLHGTKDKEVLKFLNRLTVGREFSYTSEEEAEFYGPNKPRFVDPFVLHEKSLKRVSEIVYGMKEYFHEFVKRHTFLGVRQNLY